MALTSISLIKVERVYKDNNKKMFYYTLSSYINRMKSVYLECDIDDYLEELDKNGEIVVYYKSMYDKITI